MNPPKVVGLITTYNASAFILETLRTVANQNYPNFEVIICDDSSTDDTFHLCEEFASTQDNFTVLKNQKNLGWFSNSEKLWKLGISRGKFCFLHPHDDLLFPNFIKNQVDLLLKNPDAVLAIPGMKNNRPNSPDLLQVDLCMELSESCSKTELIQVLASRKISGWWAAYHGLHRSDVVKKILPVSKLKIGNPEFTADLLWLIKVSFYGNFISTGEILFEKNYSKESVSQSWSYKDTKNKVGLWIGILDLIMKSPLSIKEKTQSTTMVLKQILRGATNTLRSQ